jgi:RNA polymerase sigma-70 factor (ECF subfamily)
MMWDTVRRRDVENRQLKRAVKRAQRGEGPAAEEIFDHYYPRVYRYALARLRSVMDAEDVAAETFARVLDGLEGFRWKDAGFEAWLFRIASNLVVDTARKSTRERPEEGILETAETAELRTPEWIALGGERRDELNALMDELVPEQREVLTLRFIAGLDTNEVSSVMDKDPNAIRQLQFRALKNLRGRMPEAVDR